MVSSPRSARVRVQRAASAPRCRWRRRPRRRRAPRRRTRRACDASCASSRSQNGCAHTATPPAAWITSIASVTVGRVRRDVGLRAGDEVGREERRSGPSMPSSAGAARSPGARAGRRPGAGGRSACPPLARLERRVVELEPELAQAVGHLVDAARAVAAEVLAARRAGRGRRGRARSRGCAGPRASPWTAESSAAGVSADAVLARGRVSLGHAVDGVVVGEREQLDARLRRRAPPPRRRGSEPSECTSATAGRRSGRHGADGLTGPGSGNPPVNGKRRYAMSTGVIIAIVVVALVLIALAVLHPAHRGSARCRSASVSSASAVSALPVEHRRASGRCANARPSRPSSKARLAPSRGRAAARRGRAAPGARRDCTSSGMADHELIDDDERDQFAGTSAERQRSTIATPTASTTAVAAATHATLTATTSTTAGARRPTPPRTAASSATAATASSSGPRVGHEATRRRTARGARPCSQQRARLRRGAAAAPTWKPWANSQPSTFR